MLLQAGTGPKGCTRTHTRTHTRPASGHRRASMGQGYIHQQRQRHTPVVETPFSVTQASQRAVRWKFCHQAGVLARQTRAPAPCRVPHQRWSGACSLYGTLCSPRGGLPPTKRERPAPYGSEITRTKKSVATHNTPKVFYGHLGGEEEGAGGSSGCLLVRRSRGHRLPLSRPAVHQNLYFFPSRVELLTPDTAVVPPAQQTSERVWPRPVFSPPRGDVQRTSQVGFV
jgi:hypothetical protein